MKLPTHISYNLKKSLYLLSWKSLSCIKFQNLKIFPNGIQIFSKPFFIYLNGRSHVIFSPGFRGEKNLNSRRSESKYESLGKSFYSLSFNFQKSFEFHSISHKQSYNQSKLSIYYNIPKFRILGCYNMSHEFNFAKFHR